MKKKLILIALAAWLPGAVCAQSSVTLYGVLDTSVSYVNHVADAQGHSSSTIAMSGSGGEWGSRFGFKGVEDLGSGYAAVFTLEQGINASTGAASTAGLAFGRLSFVGISSPYGAVTLGRQYSAMFDTIAQFWPQTRAPQFEPYAQAISIYVNNAIKYTSLTYGGFKFVGTASLGGVAGNFASGAAYSVGLTYASGPFTIAVSGDQTNTDASTVAPVGSVGRTLKFDVAAKYRLGNATLFGGYNWGRTESATAVVTQRASIYWTGVQYQFTQASVGVLGYYFEDLRYLNGKNPANPQQITLHYSYFLSKSTDVYAAVTRTWNAAINLNAVSTLAPGETGQTGIAVGIRHLF